MVEKSFERVIIEMLNSIKESSEEIGESLKDINRKLSRNQNEKFFESVEKMIRNK